MSQQEEKELADTPRTIRVQGPTLRSNGLRSGKFGKVLLLVLTLLPMGYYFFFVFFFLNLFFGVVNGQEPDWFAEDRFPVALFAAHFGAILLSIGLLGWYIVAVVKNPALETVMKLIWVLVLFQLSFFAMPVYWYLYIWRRQPPQFLSKGDAPSP